MNAFCGALIHCCQQLLPVSCLSPPIYLRGASKACLCPYIKAPVLITLPSCLFSLPSSLLHARLVRVVRGRHTCTHTSTPNDCATASPCTHPGMHLQPGSLCSPGGYHVKRAQQSYPPPQHPSPMAAPLPLPIRTGVVSAGQT